MDINKFIIDLLDIQHRKQKDLAEYLAISTSTLNNWLKLNREIPSSYIIPICEFFKISPYLLLTGTEQDVLNNLTSDEKELLENYRRLRSIEKFKVLGRIETYLEEYDYGEETDPFEEELKKETDNIISLSKYKESQVDENTYKFTTELWGEVSAGKGIESIVIREQIKTPVKCDFALRVKGDSMEPLYHDQQIIYIKQTPSVEQGQIAAVQVDDFIPAAYIKKVYIEGPQVRLVSLNPLYEDIILPAESIKILGKVIEF